MAVRGNKRRRRRGRFGFLYKLLSLVLILAAIGAGCIVFFRVEDIRVEGGSFYSKEEVIAASGVEIGDNLLLINQVRAGRRIVDELPYIDTVNPRLELPSTVVFTLNESAAAGVLEGENGQWWILNSGGKLLEQGNRTLTNKHPAITGLTPLMPAVGRKLAVSVEESAKLDSLKQILFAMEDRGMLPQLQSMDLSGVSEIRMTYAQRFTVRMPMYSDDFYHLVHTLEQAAAHLNAGQIGTLDLTGERARFIPA